MNPNFEQEAERICLKLPELYDQYGEATDKWPEAEALIAQALRKAVSDNDEKWNKANDEMLDKQDEAAFKRGFAAGYDKGFSEGRRQGYQQAKDDFNVHD